MTQKDVLYFTGTIMILKHFIMSYTFVYTFCGTNFQFSSIHSSVASSPSNGGISSASSHGQSALPFYSPIKSGRELWDGWD